MNVIFIEILSQFVELFPKVGRLRLEFLELLPISEEFQAEIPRLLTKICINLAEDCTVT